MAKNKKKKRKKKEKPAKPNVNTTSTKSAGKTVFKLVGSKDSKEYPFTEVEPEGFDFKVHKSLKKRDFAADHLYYLYRAKELDSKAAAFRKQAEEAEKLGSVKDRGRMKRLVKLQDKVAELKQQLEDQGVDVEELLKAAEDES